MTRTKSGHPSPPRSPNHGEGIRHRVRYGSGGALPILPNPSREGEDPSPIPYLPQFGTSLAQSDEPRKQLRVSPSTFTALLLFAGAAILYVASGTPPSVQPPPSVEELAEQIVKLTEGVDFEPTERRLTEIDLRDQVAKSEEENANLSQLEASKREELKKKDAEIERLKNELLTNDQSDKEEGGKLRGINQKRTEDWLWEQVKLRRQEIQAHAIQATWGFGPGPHRVQINLDFPKDSPPGPPENPDADTFVIELAPVKMMPHSVHTFLRQVKAGLWSKGCSFYHNADHILKAAPVEENVFQDTAFRDAGLTGVIFPEYNPDYPHVKYTVGFGSDEGPTFYINKRDNTKVHGPGGRKSVHGEDVGEPCFGKVVSGFDAVERMAAMPNMEVVLGEETVHNNWMKESVRISKAEIL